MPIKKPFVLFSFMKDWSHANRLAFMGLLLVINTLIIGPILHGMRNGEKHLLRLQS